MISILIDNGHGRETPGKRSPVWGDGKQLLEWEFNRDIAHRIHAQLPGSVLLVPEDRDVSLAERCARANVYRDAILISIHANAGGGTGWEVFTSPGNTAADKYATILCEEFRNAFPSEKLRADNSDGDPDKEEAFYILRHTTCPAILTENFFMDTEKDCRILLSADGRQKIADFHVAAIRRMIDK